MINSQYAMPNKRHSRTTDATRIQRDRQRREERLNQQATAAVEAPPKQ